MLKAGLLSVTLAIFITESHKKLSPDSSDKIIALIVDYINIFEETPLTSVTAQRGQPFKPTASAVRVNVLWSLSLILSLNCTLSAALTQPWARRYQELAPRRGALHRLERLQAYIFDGINRFGMARAVVTMPTLLYISIFLFFIGFVDFLFSIGTTVACALGCIMVFALAFGLAYTILPILPNTYLNFPQSIPLSGFTWRTFHFSAFGFRWTVRGNHGNSSDGLWSMCLTEAEKQHRPPSGSTCCGPSV
jgi:hypothetical protein